MPAIVYVQHESTYRATISVRSRSAKLTTCLHYRIKNSGAKTHKIHRATSVHSTHDNKSEISTQLQLVRLPNKYSRTAYLFEASYTSSTTCNDVGRNKNTTAYAAYIYTSTCSVAMAAATAAVTSSALQHMHTSEFVQYMCISTVIT